jgi:hypothetical protein
LWTLVGNANRQSRLAQVFGFAVVALLAAPVANASSADRTIRLAEDCADILSCGPSIPLEPHTGNGHSVSNDQNRVAPAIEKGISDRSKISERIGRQGSIKLECKGKVTLTTTRNDTFDLTTIWIIDLDDKTARTPSGKAFRASIKRSQIEFGDTPYHLHATIDRNTGEYNLYSLSHDQSMVETGHCELSKPEQRKF